MQIKGFGFGFKAADFPTEFRKLRPCEYLGSIEGGRKAQQPSKPQLPQIKGKIMTAWDLEFRFFRPTTGRR